MPPPPIPPRPGQQGSSLPSRPPAIAPPPFPPVIVGRVLCDGNAQGAGLLEKGVKWQASGILEEGANLPGQTVYISRPLTLHMGPSSTCGDGKGRQRTEFLSWPPAAASETHSYSWRFHLAGPIPTSSKFFHLTQILSREQGGFVVALGFVQDKIRISSVLPPLLDQMGQPLPLPEMDAAAYFNRTTYHHATVQWGPGGFVDYYIQDAVSGELLLRYSISNVNVPAQGSIKCGLYRAHVCSAATAVVGDFDFRKA